MTRRASLLPLLAILLVVPLLALTTVPAEAGPIWKQCRTRTNMHYCSYITKNIENRRLIGYRDSVWNGRKYAIRATCQASTSKTSRHSVGAKLSTEIKAGIFGGIQAEVNSSVEKSMTTGYVTSASFRVPARDTVYCDRGIVNELVKGRTRVTHFSASGSTSKTTYWTAKAPARARWWIY